MTNRVKNGFFLFFFNSLYDKLYRDYFSWTGGYMRPKANLLHENKITTFWRYQKGNTLQKQTDSERGTRHRR